MKFSQGFSRSLRTHGICLVLALFAGALSGCKDKQAGNGGGNDTYTHVASEDAVMNAAIAKAKETMPQFLAALKNRKATQHDFAVKKPYETPSGGNEHMWIADVREVDGMIEGVVANTAEETKLVSEGQRVTFKPSEISDWKYVDDGFLVGGYTIRYFVDKMSAEEKQAFENEAGFKVK